MANGIPRRTVLSIFITGFLSACGAGGDNNDDQPKKVSKKAAQKPAQANLDAKLVFAHGVASGDPDQSSVVIWTRISTPEAQKMSVSWELAEDDKFVQLISRNSQDVEQESDFTVKAIPTNLKPGKTYFYRFIVGNAISPIGRTKTLPEGDVDHFGIALASCSNYAFGYFNAYDAIAKDSDIDLVLHTGDYIYEYGADGWGGETAKKLGRAHQPANEIVSLSDYRVRHAQYKTDAGSQAMHAAHPMICCWDDHESTNNPWRNGAQNHQPETEGDWITRRNASVKAYFEWMPIRDLGSVDKQIEFARAYQIGNLASLVTLETRHTARAEQIDYADYANSIKSQADANAFKENVIGKEGRAMISGKTEELVSSTFANSVARKVPWRLIGNASPIARMLVPNIDVESTIKGETQAQLETEGAKHLIWKGKYNMPFYTDTWDGYPWAREKFYETCSKVDANDLIFLTGDSHSFWMNQLADANGSEMGLELGTAGISSPGDFVESGWSQPVAEKLDRLFEEELDEVVWTDNFHQGFVKVQLNPQKIKASFIAVSTVLENKYSTKVIKQTYIVRQDDKLIYKA